MPTCSKPYNNITDLIPVKFPLQNHQYNTILLSALIFHLFNKLLTKSHRKVRQIEITRKFTQIMRFNFYVILKLTNPRHRC